MLIRYKTGPKGRPVQQALIYTREEHGISSSQIDHEAVKITRRLQRAGFEAYVVGGAVRDLLVGKQPKDFDVATSAEPNQIRKLFRNSRVIGKRFRLVHIFFQDNKIIEVSTFRSREAEGFKNVYGDIEEDAMRRDFTMNGLYYNPQEEQILDFSGGVKDLQAGRLRPIIPLKRIFVEDPVRTIRAVKYAVSTGVKVPFLLRSRIKSSAALLAQVSTSRLSEEVFKILQSGRSKPIFEALMEYRLFPFLLPRIHALLDGSTLNKKKLFFFLDALDSQVQKEGEARRSRFIAYLCADYFYRLSHWKDQRKNLFTPAFQGIKELIRPVTPANRDVEQAVNFLIRQRENYDASGILRNGPDKDSKEGRPKAARDRDGKERTPREGQRQARAETAPRRRKRHRPRSGKPRDKGAESA